jgi:N-acetylneuraminic acid mutarotase
MTVKKLSILFVVLAIMTPAAAMAAAAPIDIGSRRELFVDRFLIDTLTGATLELHRPTYAGIVLRREFPWEGTFAFGYVTVIKDGDRYRLYYRTYPGGETADGDTKEMTCYAESTDGIHWVKPELGLFEVLGTKKNNVVLANMAPYTHNFAPLLDTHPGVSAAERYKGLGGISPDGLVAFVSADGLRWKKLQEKPVIAYKGWAFDSQNVAFWSESEKCYVCYFRIVPDGMRAIARSTSPDFVHWSAPVAMKYGDGGSKPPEHLYTNQTQPYFRAPHIYISTPARFMQGRSALSVAQAREAGISDAVKWLRGDCSDAVLMSSRGGDRYERTFMEAWLLPGTGLRNWVSRSNYPAYGIVPTGPAEMSLYVSRHNAQESVHLARYTLRTDGFVSVRAGYQGGEMLTRPLMFAGSTLGINFATSAAGWLRIEIQDAAGKPIPGFSLADCPEIIGDEIDRVVAWKGGSDVGRLAGQPIRLRVVMKEADLYALGFQPATPQSRTELKPMLSIRWSRGPNLPQGFQDSDGGVVGHTLVTACGFCQGKQQIASKPGRYPRGFLNKAWGLDLENPAAGWMRLPDFPGVARQEIFAIVVDGALYCWGGFSYSAPYCYRDGYRLSNRQGDWAWEPLPPLPSPVASSGICTIGTKIYVCGGADYDAKQLYTAADCAGVNQRLGSRLLVLDTKHLSAGWTPLPECPGTPRMVAAMAAVRGRIYLIGGATGDVPNVGYCSVVDNWTFDPASNGWSRLADLPISSGNFPAGAIVFRDRYILLVGGCQYDKIANPDGSFRDKYGTPSHFQGKGDYFNDVFVYDTQTGEFGTADKLPLNNNLPMTVVHGDEIFLIGGETGGSVVEGEPYGHHPDLLLRGRIREL